LDSWGFREEMHEVIFVVVGFDFIFAFI